jgi:methionyl aminopeptidase
VVHGIPGPRVLREGDILSLDMGVKLGGFYGDCAVTLPVGRIAADAERLLLVTQDALARGIAQVRVVGRVSDIGHAVQAHVEAHGYSVVREFVGHGIGAALHEEPQVPNYFEPGFPFGDLVLEPGHVFAIEPMVNAGSHDVRVLEDLWTVVTADGRRSAHYEHTVAVTTSGPEILTAPCRRRRGGAGGLATGRERV